LGEKFIKFFALGFAFFEFVLEKSVGFEKGI
jgi:hypothetical protein